MSTSFAFRFDILEDSDGPTDEKAVPVRGIIFEKDFLHPTAYSVQYSDGTYNPMSKRSFLRLCAAEKLNITVE